MTITQLPPTKEAFRSAPAGFRSAPAGKGGVRTVLRIALTLVAVAAAAIWLPRALPSLETLQSTFETASWDWVLTAAVLQFGSIGMLIRQQRRLLRALGTPIPLRRVAAITYSSTALAISLPAGAAISAGYSFRQFRTNGASTRTAGLALVLSGALSISSLVLMFGIGWAVSSASGPAGPIAAYPVAAAVLAFAGTTLAVVGVRLARRRRISRPDGALPGGKQVPGGPSIAGFQRRHPVIGGVVRRLRDLLQDSRSVRQGDWHLAMGTSAGKWLLDAACLYACTQAVGLQLAAWEVIGVYLGVQIARQIPLTPGGIGLVEVALITALVTAGAAAGPAAAVTILYRLFSAWLLIPVGYVVLLLTRNPSLPRVGGFSEGQL